MATAEANLTPRQRDIVGLLERGRTNKEIAVELGISEAGVKAHVSRLLLRYGAANRVALLHVITRDRGGPAGRRQDGVAVDLKAIRRSISDMRERGIDLDGEFATLRRMDIGSDHHGDAARSFAAATASPRISAAVSELRGALAGLELAFELAERLPPEAMRGPLLEVVRGRVKAALASTEALERELSARSRASHRMRRSRR